MTDWIAFDTIKENMVQYFTGSLLILAIAIVSLAFIIFLAYGMDFRYALAFTLPLLGAFYVAGWMINSSGENLGWVVNIAIMVLGLAVGWVFIKIAT